MNDILYLTATALHNPMMVALCRLSKKARIFCKCLVAFEGKTVRWTMELAVNSNLGN